VAHVTIVLDDEFSGTLGLMTVYGLDDAPEDWEDLTPAQQVAVQLLRADPVVAQGVADAMHRQGLPHLPTMPQPQTSTKE